MAYITLADAKEFIGSDQALEDDHLENLILSAEKWFDNQTNTIFDAGTNTSKTLDAKDDVVGSVLYLPEWLVSVNTITNGDGSSVATNTVLLEPRDGPPYYAIKIRSDQSFAWTYSTYHEDAITVNGAWGYSDTAPDDVKYAIKRLVKHWNQARMNSADLDRPLLTGDGITIMPSSIPQDVMEIVNFYKAKAGWGVAR